MCAEGQVKVANICEELEDSYGGRQVGKEGAGAGGEDRQIVR